MRTIMVQTYRRLGDLLVSRGHINNLQLSIALADQRLSNRRLGEILMERGFVTGAELVECLAEQYHYPVLDLDKCVIEGDALKRLHPEDALQLRALPICNTAAGLIVAIADPIDVVSTDKLHALLRTNLILHLASEESLVRRIRASYGLSDEFSPVEFPEAEKAPRRFQKLTSRLRFGTIVLFDAVDSVLDRNVTLVGLPVDDPLHQAHLSILKSASKASHAGVAQVHDSGVENDLRWTVLSKVSGENLDRILKVRGARQLIPAVELVAAVAESMDQIHRVGGEGDWGCPGNIFLSAKGAMLVPIGPAPAQYQSPSRDFDRENPGASTAFALGCLLKDCLMGLDGKQNIALPAPMQDILTNSLAWEPSKRYGSAIEVAGALRAYNWAALNHTIGQSMSVEREELLSTLDHQPNSRNNKSTPWWQKIWNKSA